MISLQLNVLTQINGTSRLFEARVIIVPMFYSIFTKDVARQFTWTGRAGTGTKPFNIFTNIRHLIFEVINVAVPHYSMKQCDIDIQQRVLLRRKDDVGHQLPVKVEEIHSKILDLTVNED